MRTSKQLCALLLALCGWSSAAEAHAPPQATGVFSDGAGGATARQWVRTNRGVIFRGAPGEPPRLLCNDAYSASLSEVAPIIVAPDGLLVASYEAGIVRIGPDGCSVIPVPAPLGARHVMDLAATSDGGKYLALLTPSGDEPGAVLVSTDTGHTWVEQGEVSGFGSALAVAPSDPGRVYVTVQLASDTGTLIHQLLVASDGGVEFSPHPVALLDSEVRAFVLAVDPLDAARVLLRTLPGNPESPERLLLSEDGGESLVEVFSAVGPLVARFDEQVVWLGGAAGLFRSDDRGQSFYAVPSTLSRVGCLSSAGGALLAGGYQDLAFGLFRAGPEHRVFYPELEFSEVSSQVECGEDSAVVSVCQGNFRDWLTENGVAGGGGSGGGSAGASTGGAAPYAGASSAGAGGGARLPANSSGDDGAGSCRFHSPTTTASAPGVLLLALAWWSRRKSRGGVRRRATP